MLSLSTPSKKLKVVLLLLLTINFLITPSCNNGDDNPSPTTVKEKVQGKWNVLSVNLKSYENNELVYEETMDDYTPGDFTVEFTKTQIKITNEGFSYSYPVDYSSTNDTFEFNDDENGIHAKGSVTFNGDQMTWGITEEWVEDGVNMKDVTTIIMEKI
ncbi:hypothetical protein NF867_11185 [Solitalea sp. MAHUQ-68]|uniref:Lipocalin-like domain-containing protein n=1 Tax=Solitalea agri TaxID=2953739 RepID=A0A9X2FAM4_9SPHI|nr:hypothetical protein [Solitalea agri]MCO4293428.1 hypothetical protein [Solitalea agri]